MKKIITHSDESIVSEPYVAIQPARTPAETPTSSNPQIPEGYVSLDDFANIFEQKMAARYAEL